VESMQELAARLKKVRIQDYRELTRYLELEHMRLLSEMVCRAALLRTESRGAHYRSDYPEEDNDRWLKSIQIRKHGSGMSLEAVPVPMTTVKV
jgi:succinate dehydrogenase/fumarate reductase flavoprotein subunit